MPLLKDLQKLQLAYPRFVDKFANARIHHIRVPSHYSVRYRIREGVLCWCDRRGQRSLMPEVLINPVVWHTHEVQGHFRPRKVISYLRNFVYWPRMSHCIKRLLRACDLCQKTKYPSRHFRDKRHSVTSSNMKELVALDFFGPLPASIRGTTYIFVVVDVFSKYTRLFVMQRTTARAAVKFMTRVVCAMIPVRTVLSDHGTQFRYGGPNWRKRVFG